MTRLLLLSLLLAAGTCCRAEVILSIDPTSQTIPLGAQASFAIDISGLGSGTSLGTYDINLGFNSSLLSYGGIVFGSQLDISGLGDIQSVTPDTGTIELFELSLDSPSELNSLQADAFTLATLTFATLTPGSNSPITLSINAIGDAYGNSIKATIENASVSVTNATAAPEPRFIWLLFAAVLVIPALRKAKTAAQS